MDKLSTSFLPNAWDRNSESAQQQTQDRALEHLTNVVGKYAPHLSASETAYILLNSFDRNNPDHLAIVNDIDIGMQDMVHARVSSSTYAPGITASEAQAQRESTGKNYYQLGPSDTVVYSYLGDANYLNEVLGRPMVEVAEFTQGLTHKVDDTGNTIWSQTMNDRLFGTPQQGTTRDHSRLQAANDARDFIVKNPGVFATETQTLYPQHNALGGQGTGGTVVGQAMNVMGGWENGAFYDVRANTPDIQPGHGNDFMKWVKGAGNGWEKSGQYKNAMNAFNRPSPMMPEGADAGARRAWAGDPAHHDPQERQGVLSFLLDKADRPSFREYATSQGRTQDITPHNEFVQENKLFWYDPATVALSAVTGGGAGALKLAAGAGIRAAAKSAALGGLVGLADEVTEPGNLLIGATYPFGAAVQGTLNKPMTVQPQVGTYAEREEQTTNSLKQLEGLTQRVQDERKRADSR